MTPSSCHGVVEQAGYHVCHEMLIFRIVSRSRGSASWYPARCMTSPTSARTVSGRVLSAATLPRPGNCSGIMGDNRPFGGSTGDRGLRKCAGPYHGPASPMLRRAQEEGQAGKPYACPHPTPSPRALDEALAARLNVLPSPRSEGREVGDDGLAPGIRGF